MQKKLLCVFLGLIALVFAGCIASDFDYGYGQVKEIKQRFSGQAFLPATEKGLLLMKKEFSMLRNSNNNAALQDLLEIELSKVEMGIELEQARLRLSRVNLSKIDCVLLESGLRHLEKADASGKRALRLIGEFQKKHPSEFMRVDFEREPLNETVLGIQNMAVYADNLKQLGC